MNKVRKKMSSSLKKRILIKQIKQIKAKKVKQKRKPKKQFLIDIIYYFVIKLYK